MLLSLSLAVMPMLTLSLHAGLQRAVCGSLAVQLSPAAASPKCFLGGKREILLNFYFHPAKKNIELLKEEKLQIPGDSSEAAMYFPKVRWRTKPCSTRARLIWGNLRRKEQGRGRVFFKKAANKANSDGNLRGSRAHFYINYSSPACPALRVLLLQREDTLGEIASSFFTYTCREKNSLARF